MTASGEHEQAAPVFEDTTLSFSDEEWLELAAWQRELYRTVMRDTMDLVTSLGYLFLKREESEQRDSAETEETALEDVIHIPETALEDVIHIPETALEDVIHIPETALEDVIHIPETALEDVIHIPETALEDVIHIPETALEDVIHIPETALEDVIHIPETALEDVIHIPETALEDVIHIPETAVEDVIHIPETAVTLAPSSGELFSPYPVTDGRPPITGAQKTLGEEKSDSPDRETTENKDGPPIAGPRTEALMRTLEDASSPNVAFGPVLSGFSVDLFNGGDQEGTQDLLDDSKFLTVIKVEEINVTIGSEIKSLHSDRWEGHPEYPNKEERWDLQGGVVLPLASTDPHNNYLPCTDNQRVLSPGTLQWTVQTPLTNDQCVEEGGAWGTVVIQQMSPPDSLYTENFYKCSMCGQSFLQNPNYHERLQLEDGAFSCPTCSSHLLSDQHRLPLFLRDGQPDINSTHRPSQDKPNVTCPKCKRSFSQLSGLHRHMKSHSRNKTPVKVTAPPPRKVNDRPILQDNETRSTTQSSREAYSKLHRHLQLSTAFLQQLITSTGGFQYD